MAEVVKYLAISFTLNVADHPIDFIYTFDGSSVISPARAQVNIIFPYVVKATQSQHKWIAVVEQAMQNMDLSIPTGIGKTIKEEVTMTDAAILKLEIRGQEVINLSVNKTTQEVTFFPREEIEITWQEFLYFQHFMERNVEYVTKWLS